MPLKPGNSPATISSNISELTHHGSRPRSHAQIVAIALANADRLPKRASGGTSSSGLAAADYPTVTVSNSTPQYSGLGMFTPAPGTNGLPYALQMKAIQEAQKAQQLPDLSRQQTGSGPITPYGAQAGGPMAAQVDPSAIEGPPQPQQQMAAGGGLKMSGGVDGVLKLRPPRSLARATEPIASGGFLHSAIPGRTDRLAINVAHGSHIIPADVVSSLGQGNSLAGARHLDMTLRALPQVFKRGGHVAPSPPPRVKGHEPILAAGGEYIVPPEEVVRVGEGDRDKGHKRLDKMIVSIRRKEAKRMLKLPPPKK